MMATVHTLSNATMAAWTAISRDLNDHVSNSDPVTLAITLAAGVAFLVLLKLQLTALSYDIALRKLPSAPG